MASPNLGSSWSPPHPIWGRAVPGYVTMRLETLEQEQHQSLEVSGVAPTGVAQPHCPPLLDLGALHPAPYPRPLPRAAAGTGREHPKTSHGLGILGTGSPSPIDGDWGWLCPRNPTVRSAPHREEDPHGAAAPWDDRHRQHPPGEGEAGGAQRGPPPSPDLWRLGAHPEQGKGLPTL